MKKPLWYSRLERWVEGDAPPLKEPAAHTEHPEEVKEETGTLGPSLIRGTDASAGSLMVQTFGIVCCAIFAVLMLRTIAYLPVFGDSQAPAINETIQRYIESGLSEVGATNLVTNIILVYRGFDTYGESCVLFLGATAVIMLLEADRKNTTKEDEEELRASDAREGKERNHILGHIAQVLMPIVMLYGLYILCNGHLSPGGGFAGGSILGGALILCENAFGVSRVRKFFSHKVYHVIKVGALILYAVLICYTIYVGANGLPNIIPLGRPGSILSAGIILPINVAVGLEVACTMYAFYTYFGRGDL